MKKILPLCLLLAACQTDQPTVESINAAQAARDGKCEQQGYKRGSKDFYTCTRLSENKEAVDAQQGQLATTMGVGTAVMVGASLLSDERVKRDIIKTGLENGFNIYRFRYLWSDAVYEGVLAQEVELTRPDAITRGDDGFLRVDYRKIQVVFRQVQ